MTPVNVFNRFAARVTYAVLLSLLSLVAPALAQPPTGFAVEDVLTGLNQPISIRFLPDGRMLLAQKQGPIRIVDVLATPPTVGVYMDLTLGQHGLNFGGERGVLDITIDPQFPQSPYVYVFFTPNTGPNGARARVSRFTHRPNGGGVSSFGDLSTEVILWQDTDPYDSCCHYGGGLDFGPDGNLWLTTGDHFQGGYANSLHHAGGKVHRFTKTGGIPAGNPFVDGSGPNVDSIFAFGLRNPFRSRWDRVRNRYQVAEVGGNTQSTAWEDLHVIRYDPSSGRFIDNDYGTPQDNLVYDGINFGWPTVEGLPPHTDFPGAIIDSVVGEPIFAYKHQGSGAAITGGIAYWGNQFPIEYFGGYFYADSTRNFVRFLQLDANGAVLPNPDPDPLSFLNPDTISYSFDLAPVGRIVSLDVGPDGALYYVSLADAQTGLGAVRRYVFDGGNTRPRITRFEAVPSSGSSPLQVQFNITAVDDESDPMTYVVRFGDGQSTSPATLPGNTNTTVPHIYSSDGRYEVQLEVSDSTHTSVATIVVRVGTPPVISSLTTTNPRPGASNNMFRFGDTLVFAGSATDAEDGALAAQAFSWSVVFVRPSATHPVVGPVTNTKSIDFPIPDQGQGFSGPVFYRVTLTVTDSSGLSTSATLDVFPEKTNIQFQTNPTGIVVQVDGNTAAPAPFVLDTLVNYNHTINVPTSVCINDVAYRFGSWSTGSTSSKLVYNVPPANSSLTATYTSVGPCTDTPPTGLVMHLTSDAGVAISAGTVQQWLDQTPNGNDLTSAGAPTYIAGAINGRGAVHLDGVDDALAKGGFAGLPIGNGARSVFIVVRYNVATSTSGWVGFTYGTPLNNAAFGVCLTPTGVLGVQGWGSGHDVVSNPPTPGVGAWLIQGAVFGGGVLTQYANGTAIGTASRTYNTGTAAIRLGEELSGKKNLNMDVAEVLVYNRALNASELAHLHQYFAGRYAIGSTSSNTPPSVAITSPADGLSIDVGAMPITLAGQATDAQDGNLSSSLRWTSSRDGLLGTGASISVNLSVGTHQITASARDAQSLEGTDTITVTVTTSASGELITSGLVVRLDTEDVTVQADGRVSGWSDLSGMGNSLLPGGDPRLISNATPAGRPAISFDGIDDKLERIAATHPLTGLPIGGSNRTVFLVTRYNAANASTAGWVGFAYGTATSNRVFGLALTPSGLLGVQGWGSGNDFVSSPPTNGVGEWLIQSATLDNNTMTLYRDGIAIGSFVHTYNTGTTAIRLAEELNGNKNLNMDVAAVLVYSRALTAAERSSVIGYLQQRFFESSGNSAPTVTITAPGDGAVIAAGTSTAFTATATDAEDGNLAASTTWSSSIDGSLGTGASITATLSAGSHVITASVVDGGGSSGTDTISVTVSQGGQPSLPLAGLVTHFEIDAGLILNGAVVQRWDDQGSAGNSLSATGGPTFQSGALNGHGFVHFDGVDDVLSRLNPTGLPAAATNRSVFMLVRYNATNPSGTGWAGFAFGTASSNRAFGPVLTPTGRLGVQGWGSTYDFVSSPPTAGVGFWLVQGAIVNNNVVTQYINALAIGSRSQIYNTGASVVRLGEELNGNLNLNMDVAEVLVYNRALSPAELQDLIAYLQAKYGYSQ